MAKSQSFHWEKSPEQAFVPGFQAYLGEIETALHRIAQLFAPQIEAWMKENAIWTDRTGNARQSLYAEVEALVLGARIALDYGVSYGVFLELGMQGVFQIIFPALDYWGPIVWAEVQRRFST